ncbi:MAG: serine/threonine-protein kinase [Thermoanaerobaculia bacterium]
MGFFCISCKSAIDANFKACPFCGEPITDFLRRYLDSPIDGKYQILSRLGIGGMGEVYKVLHVHLKTIRVIKMMRPNMLAEADAHERFIREARLATRIHHPNVATLYDFSALPDGSYYMVWEYIEGTTIADLLRARGSLSPRYAASISIQALRGLDSIHRAGVVHRDVSPENLMITRDEEGEERVKIIDLGIAKQWGETGDDKTKTGIFVGKWKYCSPEHLGMLEAGERIDGRADLYSFGILMYEALAGIPPFLADTPHGYLMLHGKESPKPLGLADEALEAIIFRALEKDRTKRFATAREMADALRDIVPALSEIPTGIIMAAGRDDVTVERLTPEERVEAEYQTARATIDGRGDATIRTAPAAFSDSTTIRTDPRGIAVEEVTQTATTIQAAKPFGLKTLSIPTLRDDAGRPRPLWAIAAAALLVVVIAASAILWRRGSKSEVTAAPVQASAVVTAAAEPARLSINAFPWAEVAEVKDRTTGKVVHVTENDKITPTMLALPAGSYEVTLRNPLSSKREKFEIDLVAGKRELLSVEFVQPDALPTFERGGR